MSQESSQASSSLTLPNDSQINSLDSQRTTVVVDIGDDMESDEDEAENEEAHAEDESESEAESASDTGTTTRENIIEGLENIVLQALEDLGSILRAASGNPDESIPKGLKIELARRDGSGHRTIKWPKGKNASRNFARAFKVIEMVHGAVVSDSVITKREIYYHDVGLFGKQAVVDQLVDDLAATFGAARSDLNVTASPKGLMCGANVHIFLKSGQVVRPEPTEPMLVPTGEDIVNIGIGRGKFGWVLVVEKEAIFKTLCARGLASSPLLSRRGLIITGKGQPDVNTRKLLAILAEGLGPDIPILILVDGDPHGLEIASVYKFGSMKMQHEAEDLKCSRAEVIGLSSSDLARFDLPRESLLTMSENDIKKVCVRNIARVILRLNLDVMEKSIAMLRRDPSVMPRSWKSSLTYFLHIRRKAELEILSSAKFDRIPLPSSLQAQAHVASHSHSSQDHTHTHTHDDAREFSSSSSFINAWNELRKGSMLVPYLISKISAYLPPLDVTGAGAQAERARNNVDNAPQVQEMEMHVDEEEWEDGGWIDEDGAEVGYGDGDADVLMRSGDEGLSGSDADDEDEDEDALQI